MIKTKIQDLQINIFSGFYQTILSEGYFDHGSEVEHLKEINVIPENIENNNVDFNFNYHQYMQDVTEAYVDHLEDYLIKHELAKNVEFSKLTSPKFYNYSTDKLYISCDLNIANLEKIITENLEEFQAFLNENYKSCSGFISFIEDNANNFLIGFKKLDPNYLSIALEFCMLFLYEDGEGLAFDLDCKSIEHTSLSIYIESIEIFKDNEWITLDF